jgi:VanZ family protein
MFFKNTYPALLWALFIAILCGIPGKDIPHISFLELLSFDKFVHAALFFVLVILLSKAFQKSSAFSFFYLHPYSSSAIICIAYGGLLEILQGLIFIDRSADIYDFIANTFGCCCAIFYRKRRNVKRLV